MREKILFVDDEIRVLSALRRQLVDSPFDVETAVGPEEGLTRIRDGGPHAVVVSDLRMPGMDGISFLSRVGELAPDTVRMMLTGYADLDNAIEAVNRGRIFRFLVKPCEMAMLRESVEAGVAQYRLVTAERELLDRTLKGCIELLTDLLNIANPQAFVRASRLLPHARDLANALKLADVWQVETAAMLSQVGYVLLPEDILNRMLRHQPLTNEEKERVVMHPQITAELLDHIPRMKDVSRFIAYQNKCFDGTGAPRDAVKGEEIPIGGRILKVLLDYDFLVTGGATRLGAVRLMKKREGWYDPHLLETFEGLITGGADVGMEEASRMDVTIETLRAGMVLAENITVGNRVLIAKGQTLTRPYIERLRFISGHVDIQMPIQVYR